MAARRRGYGDAADEGMGKGPRGCSCSGIWVATRPLVISIASRAEGNPYLRALSGCEVASSGPGGGRVGGGEAIPGR